MADTHSDDPYLRDVVARGDKGSALLYGMAKVTCEKSPYARQINHPGKSFFVLNIPKGHNVYVHSASGDPIELGVKEHATSLVERLCKQAETLGATPIAFANVIDSHDGDLSMLEKIAGALVSEASKRNLAILNGENAILGSRIPAFVQANVSGTMISISANYENPNCSSIDGVNYFSFDPKDEAVFVNSDGVGTKVEFYERASKHWRALLDALAMTVDDDIKFGADAKGFSGTLEKVGRLSANHFFAKNRTLLKKLGIHVTLQEETCLGRINGYSRNAFHLSGSVVSTISQHFLDNPLVPQEGDYLVAVRGESNPRSNGISAKRELMRKWLGPKWHETTQGKDYLDNYLAQPSTILYPLFKQLINQNLVHAVYHMSGGAYDGKLARPLAQAGLFIEMEKDALLKPRTKERELVKFGGVEMKHAYGKWPMGVDGFVATHMPDETVDQVRAAGYEAKVCGPLQRNGQTGVKIHTYTGETVRFEGK